MSGKVVTDEILKKQTESILQLLADNIYNFVEYTEEEIRRILDGIGYNRRNTSPAAEAISEHFMNIANIVIDTFYEMDSFICTFHQVF